MNAQLGAFDFHFYLRPTVDAECVIESVVLRMIVAADDGDLRFKPALLLVFVHAAIAESLGGEPIAYIRREIPAFQIPPYPGERSARSRAMPAARVTGAGAPFPAAKRRISARAARTSARPASIRRVVKAVSKSR